VADLESRMVMHTVTAIVWYCCKMRIGVVHPVSGFKLNKER